MIGPRVVTARFYMPRNMELRLAGSISELEREARRLRRTCPDVFILSGDERLPEHTALPVEKVGYGIMVLLIVSSFAGAMISFGRIKRQRMLVCIVSGVIYFAMLMSMTALFFGGQYSAVGTTALLVLAGSGAAALLGLRQGRGAKRTKIKVPHR